MQLIFDPQPKLIIGDAEYSGINIVEKLHQLSETDENAVSLLTQIVNTHNKIHIPRLGFYIEDARAVVPTKRPIDVGYDITIIDVAKQLTPITTLYETGIALDIPLGYYVEMIPRSSLSKTGYMFANSIGVIDPCYTGTLKVALVKVDPSVPDIAVPSRVAQIILKPYVYSSTFIADKKYKLDTQRGSAGFGST
jgi:deoxyuridine 5'-triphosphate nucleotidohydrolase